MPGQTMPFERKLLRRILNGQTDPRQLARAMCGLHTAADSYAELKLSQQRVGVVDVLAALMEDKAPSETKRRLCNDLLKTQPPKPPEPVPSEPPPQSEPNSYTPELLHRALELIGSGKLDQEQHQNDPGSPNSTILDHV